MSTVNLDAPDAIIHESFEVLQIELTRGRYTIPPLPASFQSLLNSGLNNNYTPGTGIDISTGVGAGAGAGVGLSAGVGAGAGAGAGAGLGTGTGESTGAGNGYARGNKLDQPENGARNGGAERGRG